MQGSWRGARLNATTAAEIVLANGGVVWYTKNTIKEGIMALTVQRAGYLGQFPTIHRAKIIDHKIVPICRTISDKPWHRLPGNYTVNCKLCKALPECNVSSFLMRKVI